MTARGKQVLKRRLVESVAMLMIGDCVLGCIAPRGHIGLWNSGSGRWRRIMQTFERHPGWTRAMAFGGLAAGIWLGLRQERPAKSSGIKEGFQAVMSN